MTYQDDITPTNAIPADAIVDGAASICPARHRRNADPKEPPCSDCLDKAETVLLAAYDRLTQPADDQ